MTTYYLRSTALGGEIIEELNSTGHKNVGYVALPGGQLLATQTAYSNQVVIWKHNTPGGTSEYTVNSYNGVTSRVEFDPLGADISLTEPPQPPPGENEGEIGAGHFGSIMDQRWTDFFNLSSGFTVGGFSISSSEAAFYLNFGTGQSSINNVGVSPRDVANALGAVFAGVGAGSVNIRVSGVEGTPGHQTIEYAWTYAEGYGWYYGPTATAYSGVTATVGSVVSLASNISLRAVQPQNPILIPLGDLKGNLEALLKKGDCEKYTTALLAEAAKLFAGSYPHVNTVMEGYGMISSQGNYVFKKDGYDTVGGDLFANGASPGTVLLLQNGTNGAPTSKQVSFFQGMYTFKALHETMHLGKQWGYDDFQLASAAYSYAGNTLEPAPKGLTGFALVAHYSRKVDQELKKHCPYPQQ